MVCRGSRTRGCRDSRRGDSVRARGVRQSQQAGDLQHIAAELVEGVGIVARGPCLIGCQFALCHRDHPQAVGGHLVDRAFDDRISVGARRQHHLRRTLEPQLIAAQRCRVGPARSERQTRRAIDGSICGRPIGRLADGSVRGVRVAAGAVGPRGSLRRGTVKLIGGLIVRVLCVGSGGKPCPSSRSGGGGNPGDLVPDGEAVGHLVAPSSGRQQMPPRT